MNTRTQRHPLTTFTGRLLPMLGLLCCLTPAVAAQDRADSTVVDDTVVDNTSMDSTVARPVFALFGEVRVDALRFLRPDPYVRVRFFGNATDTLKHAVRTNLPRPVRTDTTYRNVRVYFEVYSGFEDLDRLLEESLRRARGAAPDTTQPDRRRP